MRWEEFKHQQVLFKDQNKKIAPQKYRKKEVQAKSTFCLPAHV